MGKFISRFFLTAFLLVLAGSAFADSTTTTNLSASAVTNHTDLSLAYLAQVFGSVGNVLHGSSGQMLGHLFYILNQGILIVAGLWLGYTTITVVLKSAQEGSFMGVNKNVAVLFLKIALGFGLLMPNPATGYSIFQDVVMKVVVEGVALADLTWDNGLSYINHGGTIWRRPETGDKLLSSDKISTLTNPMQQVFASEVCMIASNAYYEEKSAANNSNNSDNNANNIANMGGSSARHFSVKETKNGFEFPGVGNQQGLPNNETGNCGSITWTNIKNATGDQAQYPKDAVSRIVYNVLPAAHEYFCGSGSNLATNYSVCNDTSANYNQDVPEAFFGGLVDYVNAIYPFAQSQTKSAYNSAKDFMHCSDSGKCAQNEGWLMAGRYYWDLSRIQSHLRSVSDISHYAPSATAENSAIDASKDVKAVTNNALKDSADFMKAAMVKLHNYDQASHKGDGDTDHKLALNIEKSIISDLATPVFHDITHLLIEFTPGQMGSDPILFLHTIGMDSIAIAGDIWIGLGFVILASTVLTMVCRSSLDTDAVVQNVSAWLKPIFMMIATALLGVGVVLGYYVPLYPYMLFTFGVIGWIIAVIEAMVAAPLVCLGLTHPEGHDFLGAAQQALMLLLGVFLRPVLMVIGLIGGMIMSYVSFRIVIYTFSGFIMDMFYMVKPTIGGNNDVIGSAFKVWGTIAAGQTIHGSLGGLSMTILVVPLVLVVFTMLIYVVTNQCFSLIYLLPDNILRWIGGPQSQSVASQMAQEIKGAMSGFGQTMGKGISDGTSSLKPMPSKGQMDVENDGNDENDGSSGGKNKKDSPSSDQSQQQPSIDPSTLGGAG